jgi:hypothetical protein
MSGSWDIWMLSAVVLIGGMRFLRTMPSAGDFRMVAGGLGLLALTAAAAREELRWHLIWFIPAVLVVGYVYALRHLFALSHRLNQLGQSGISDPKQMRRAIQGEVEEYNRKAPDDSQMG